jgi:hypothetical protein
MAKFVWFEDTLTNLDHVRTIWQDGAYTVVTYSDGSQEKYLAPGIEDYLTAENRAAEIPPRARFPLWSGLLALLPSFMNACSSWNPK